MQAVIAARVDPRDKSAPYFAVGCATQLRRIRDVRGEQPGQMRRQVFRSIVRQFCELVDVAVALGDRPGDDVFQFWIIRGT